jgi:hypothetical protein
MEDDEVPESGTFGGQPVLDRVRVGMTQAHAADQHFLFGEAQRPRDDGGGRASQATCGQVSRPRAFAASITFCRNMP